jgi:parvulin-like peptidyl-prolyl isomerase
LRILPIVSAVLIGVMLIIVGAGGTYYYLNNQLAGDRSLADQKSPDAPNKVAIGVKRLEKEALFQLLALTDAPRRDAILESAVIFDKFVSQEMANQAVLSAARANQVHSSDAVAALMERASQKVLAAAYLTQVIKRNMNENFPNERQRHEYYETNAALFQLLKRVHMWQIFIPANTAMAPTVEKNAVRLAAQLAAGLQKGSKSFAKVAVKHSKHLESRVNDGYMGLLKLDDLLPEVRAAVEKLAVDAVSAPTRSKSGFYIIKKGAAVAGSQLAFASVEEQISSQMRKAAENRVRQAAVKKILESYPVEIDESEIARWRDDFSARQWPIRSIALE